MAGEPSGVLIFCTVVLAISGVVLTIAIVSRLARWSRGEVPLLPGIVKDLQVSAPVIMSRPSESTPQEAPSSVETRPAQTPDQTVEKAARQKKLLDTYTILKRLGLSRDAARAFLSPWGIPLDNNLWAQVPAEPEPEHVTPIAGRPTKASYYPDQPDLEFQPPPS